MDITFRIGMVLPVVVMIAACGDVSPQHDGIVVQGVVSGVYRPGPPAVCGAGTALVTGPYGANPLRDDADLTVSDDGSFTFTPSGYPTFSGHGVTFRDGQGWDVDGEGIAPNGTRLHLLGRLSCGTAPR